MLQSTVLAMHPWRSRAWHRSRDLSGRPEHTLQWTSINPPYISVIIVVYSKRRQQEKSLPGWQIWTRAGSRCLRGRQSRPPKSSKFFTLSTTDALFRYTTQHGWLCCNNILLALDWSLWVRESRTIALCAWCQSLWQWMRPVTQTWRCRQVSQHGST